MKNTKIIALLLAILSPLLSFAQRTEIPLNDNWNFRFSHQVQKNSEQRVDLPHTWNAKDALAGEIAYKRGIGNYRKPIFVKEEWAEQRIFLRFEGVNTIANLFINGKHVGEHRGGYAAFIFEITDRVDFGKENEILVRVNNAEQLDIMPLVGDFNFYGGIYRGVELLVTDKCCISPIDFASSGVYITQTNVSDKSADISTKVKISTTEISDNLSLSIAVNSADGKELYTETKEVTSQSNEREELFDFTLKNPHLWNGQQDPYLHQVVVSLYNDGKLIDCVKQPLGIRSFHVDANEGFYLNGKQLDLNGVCRHQERAIYGNALHNIHHEEDVDLMLEMGVNAVRLAHYHQAKYVYDLMDKHGFVVWAEIPFVGPGGYADKGFVDLPAFKENGKEQLRELIRQNYNHPSICFWGLFNELKEEGDNPIPYIDELRAIAESEDTTRPTVAASNQDGDINHHTELIAWNRYDGWYEGMPSDLGVFLDNMHASHPELKIGVSEYGAGASIFHQQEKLEKADPVSFWHPENWQTYYHMENWKAIAKRPYVWGSFVWNMFDFGAAHRTEGDQIGVNDKGLVTHDRKIKKDAYYFYKANWNKAEPMLYLAEKRIVNRSGKTQQFMAFTTAKKVELLVNGKSVGTAEADNYATVLWENVELQEGKNSITVRDTKNKSLSDTVTITLLPEL